MKLLGAHLSISKGLGSLQRQMDMLDCSTCALFLKNQRTFNTRPLKAEQIKEFQDAVKAPEILLPHGSYLVNLANPETIEKSYNCFKDDVERCAALGIRLYNIHPGADVKRMGDGALKLISEQINRVHRSVPGVVVLLENMAGQGTACGRTFEELARIIDGVSSKERIGVTLDTCHLFGGGYDIRTEEGFENVMDNFNKTVGLGYLKGVHLNDSKCPLDSRKDRHEQIGKGYIGIEAFSYIMNSSYFDDIPMILETPDEEQYKSEIKLLRGLEARARI